MGTTTIKYKKCKHGFYYIEVDNVIIEWFITEIAAKNYCI